MKRYHRMLALVMILLTVFNVSALTGSWRGRLSLGTMSLPLVFNFSEDASGQIQCTIDSPSQGATGIPASVELCTADSVSVSCGVIGASYEARIESTMLKGTFRQRGYSFPLDLEPDSPAEERRPQTPKPPFPYSVTDTVFTAPDGAVMSASLTMPADIHGTKVPAVVMVTGSGPQNRDEELFEHKPFAVIADYLARHGIASLRYDDRGTGKSGGDFVQATTHTFADDAKAAVTLLRSLPNVGKVGILGHSEGGTIAFMLASESVSDFIITLAGMAESAKKTLMDQNSHALDLSGIKGEDKEQALRMIELVFDEMKSKITASDSSPIDIDSLLSTSGLKVNPAIVSSLKSTQNTRTSWFDAFLMLKPGEYLEKVKCPVLALNGDKDTQVSAEANLTLIKEKIPQADTRVMSGLNHMMQHANTGEVSEYAEIRETISPEVLEIISDFICRSTDRR